MAVVPSKPELSRPFFDDWINLNKACWVDVLCENHIVDHSSNWSSICKGVYMTFSKNFDSSGNILTDLLFTLAACPLFCVEGLC